MKKAIRRRVVFALTGNVWRNSRALKQIQLLFRLGFEVTVYSLGTRKPAFLPPEVRVKDLPRPDGTGPLFFYRNIQLFKKELRETRADIYHASDLYVLPAVASIARQHQARLVYDARECYPHVVATRGRPWVRWFWRLVERRGIRRADAIFTVSRSIAHHMAGAYQIRPPFVLHNAPPLRPVPASKLLHTMLNLAPETVIFLHQGQIQPGRGCDRMVEAFRQVQGGVMVFLGGGALKEALRNRVRAYEMESRVFFLEPVPPEELLIVTSSADVGISLLEDNCLNHRYALPNKLFEYLMAGVPVLGSKLPEMEGVLLPHQAGWVVDPANVTALTSTMQTLVDNPEARQKAAERTRDVFETFSWEKASKVFCDVYKTLI